MAQLMPQLDAKLTSMQKDIRALQDDIRGVDAKIDNLRQDMADKFEQANGVSNELSQRIARVEGGLDAISKSIDRQSHTLDRQSDRIEQWIERVVKVEMTQVQRSRGKRAG